MITSLDWLASVDWLVMLMLRLRAKKNAAMQEMLCKATRSMNWFCNDDGATSRRPDRICRCLRAKNRLRSKWYVIVRESAVSVCRGTIRDLVRGRCLTGRTLGTSEFNSVGVDVQIDARSAVVSCPGLCV